MNSPRKNSNLNRKLLFIFIAYYRCSLGYIKICNVIPNKINEYKEKNKKKIKIRSLLIIAYLEAC